VVRVCPVALFGDLMGFPAKRSFARLWKSPAPCSSGRSFLRSSARSSDIQVSRKLLMGYSSSTQIVVGYCNVICQTQTCQPWSFCTQLMRPLDYFCGGTLTGTCGVALTTLTLSAEAILLSVSSTRKNFSASMAGPPLANRFAKHLITSARREHT